MTGTAQRSTEDLSFLQHRLAAFGLVAGGVSTFALLARVAIEIVTGGAGILRHPSLHYHLLGTAAFLAIWVVCRGRGRRPS